jgi:protease-4
MDEHDGSSPSPLRAALTILLIVLLPLAIGVFLANRLLPKPQVGIVRLSYDIGSLSTYEIAEQLREARENPAIKAVVVIINSPGGSAAFSEELFLDVLATRRELPVVASIDLVAASGAYYMAAATNEIYAKPTSSVGSVGVIAALPGDAFIEEDLLTTGPYKAFGGTRDGYVRQIERAKLAFLSAVETGRGERLAIDSETLSRAEIYTGVQALEFGLVDGLASSEEALQRAAELAGLRDFETVELYPLTFDTDFIPLAEVRYRPEPIDEARLWAAPNALAPGLYYRYVEPGTGQ